MKNEEEVLFPELLYETIISGNQPCFVCGKYKAVSILRSTEREVAPICQQCSSNWNFYGYIILKKINQKELLLNLSKFKICNLFYTESIFAIYNRLQVFKDWAIKMKKFRNGRKDV